MNKTICSLYLFLYYQYCHTEIGIWLLLPVISTRFLKRIPFENALKVRQNVYFLHEFTFYINGAEWIKAPFIKQPCTTILRYIIHYSKIVTTALKQISLVCSHPERLKQYTATRKTKTVRGEGFYLPTGKKSTISATFYRLQEGI